MQESTHRKRSARHVLRPGRTYQALLVILHPGVGEITQALRKGPCSVRLDRAGKPHKSGPGLTVQSVRAANQAARRGCRRRGAAALALKGYR